jgi:type IV pilus assembly protein PilE
MNAVKAMNVAAMPARRPGARRFAGGFTLIELMIVVAVVAILAAIAYPAYRDHVRRSHRTAAASFLMDLALRQQQQFLDTRAYADTLEDLRAVVPPEVSDHYDITIDVGTGAVPSYTISAEPTGAQAEDATCGTLSIDSDGTKDATGNQPERCW